MDTCNFALRAWPACLRLSAIQHVHTLLKRLLSTEDQPPLAEATSSPHPCVS